MTNPIFESAGSWDLLCDVGTGRMTVHKDIHNAWPPVPLPTAPGLLLPRAGTLKAEGSMSSEDDIGRISNQPRDTKEPQGSKSDFVAKADSADNIFIEDVGAIWCSSTMELALISFSLFLADHLCHFLPLRGAACARAVHGIRPAFRAPSCTI